VNRRDFAIGLLLASATRSVQAQERAKQHRIAIVIPAGPVALISDTSSDALSRRLYHAFFEELRRLGDVEGQYLIVERYSGEGAVRGLCESRSRGRQPEPGCDCSHYQPHRAGGPRGLRYNTDRLDRG
jgi:hypothetical protein